ncbi:MAG: HEAT repeat domain-containing protein, partial [Planctomycetes bacterium]|nr:HEAT repeat domain-containing protein [Planctomycetota bacterium]
MRFPQSRFRSPALVLTIGLTFAALWSAAAAQPPVDDVSKDYSSELPRIPPHEPAEAMDTFQVQPGYELQQVAAEPLVASPVAVSFDENGRLYVVEMRDYSEQETERLGTIRLLEDTDEDGRFDKSTVFLDDLSWPTAAICYDGGVFVGAAPDLLYAKDTDGDGRADLRRVVFTGFDRSNVQGLMNTLQWGLDHRIHGATSSSGAALRPGDDAKTRPVTLRGRDFAFDPRTLKVETTSGGAQHGMSFDDWGRKFVCSNSDHLQLVMFEDRYVARNPYLVAPSARISIAADGPQAEVFRSSPVEPWRIVRTRLRVSGVVKGPIEGGGRAAGYFTGATGATIYRGNAWPEQDRGLAIIGDVGSNIIHRKRLEPDGVGLVGRRIDEKSEFVASTDTWFRPAQFANAPDGALYVIDVYREVIEHPKSLPEMIKKHLDLTSGRDRGRIYRIVPAGFKQPKLPRLGGATTAELVALLEHPNGWHRDTAGRLLYERQDKAAVEPLRRLTTESKSPLARMHALFALDALAVLDAESVLRALADEHAYVREHAVRLSERVLEESTEVRRKLYTMVGDDDPRVRYQLAFTLGEISERRRNEALSQLAMRDGGDSWVRLAILSSLSTGAGDVLARVAADEEYRQSDAGRGMLEALASQVGANQQKDEVTELLAVIQSLPPNDSLLAQSL